MSIASQSEGKEKEKRSPKENPLSSVVVTSPSSRGRKEAQGKERERKARLPSFSSISEREKKKGTSSPLDLKKIGGRGGKWSSRKGGKKGKGGIVDGG